MSRAKPNLPLLDLTPSTSKTRDRRRVKYVDGKLMRGNHPYVVVDRPPPVQPVLPLPAAIRAPDPRIGCVLKERFEIVRLLARGGMGSVYVAFDSKNEDEVAVKFLDSKQLESPKDAEARFRAEALVISKLEDARILKALSHGRTEKDELFIVTELLDGVPMSTELEMLDWFDQTRVIRLLIDICWALSKAHAAGVVHRDLKPGNIFLGRGPNGEEMARVLDFGIAKLTRKCVFAHRLRLPLTQTGAVMGTPGYIAPEQLKNETITGQSDLYSLGVLGYECLTGRLPYNAGGLAILAAPLFKNPVPIHEVMTERPIHPALGELIMQMIQKDPLARPHTAKEVRIRLESILDSLVPTKDKPHRPVAPMSKRIYDARRGWMESRKTRGGSWWSFARRFAAFCGAGREPALGR